MLNQRSVVVSFVAVCLALASCEKDRKSAGSGPLDAADKALFQYLPRGQTVLAGGNYMKLQNFMQTGLGQASTALAANMGPGMSEWMTCFSDLPDLKKLRIGASLSFTGKDGQLRMVLGGATVDDIAGCAQKASFKATIDPDHKFIAVEMPPPAATAGYLVLPSGALYARQQFALTTNPQMTSPTRAELEADIAGLGKDTAADDPALEPLVEKVDRSKTVWMVGRGDRTPVADKIGGAWGTMDFAGGLAIDFTIQVKVADDAKKAEDGFAQLQKRSDQLPGDLKDVVKAMTLKRSGDELHLIAKASDAQLKSIVGQLGGMLGAAAPPHREVTLPPRP